ncbi:MAG: carboxypeptidase-like regulatory domain-containing protein [Candidatus Latescibacter sp.]|nr:carboxypeptidase-like regulatory domain-containing protein [Candidatus Latescibacter sp.]
MKKLLALSAVTLLLIAGCLTSSDDKKDDTNNNNNNGTGGSYSITGSVKTGSTSGTGLSGVAVTLTGPNNIKLTATTVTDGSYSFSNLADGNYSVAAVKSGYTFDQASIAVTVKGASVAVTPLIGTQTSSGTGTTEAYLYLPYKVGATWSYKSHSVSGTYTFDDTYTEKVTGTKISGGKTYLISVKSYKDYSDTSYVRIENNIAYLFMENVDLSLAKTAKPARINKTSMINANLELPMFKFGINPGTSYTIYSLTQNGVTVSFTGKYIGLENATVTAGSFQNCAKYEITSLWQSTSNNVVSSDTNVMSIWFAPNVGLVKEEDVYTAQTGSVKSVSTESMALVSYSIPK